MNRSMKTEDFNVWFEVQKVTNKNYSKEQFDSIRDILEECWNYSKESVKENNINIDDCEYDDINEMQDRIDELESALEEIHSLSGV